MRFLIAIFIVIQISAKGQVNHVLGIGVGSELLAYDLSQPTPFYSDKDISVFYSPAWKYFTLEARQSLRYDSFFDNNLKSSSYVLLGFSTLKEKFFSFNILFGGIFSTMPNQKNDQPYQNGSNYYYPSQLKPVIKLGLSVRACKNTPLYIGLDCLASPFRYYYSTGSTGGSGSISGTALLSVNYLFKSKE